MDVFSRTFLPATSEAGLPIPVVSRHMPVLRRCVTPEETTVLVARCQRIGAPIAGTFLLLLTNRRLVVSKESRLLHRVQLHLAATLRDLSEVGWVPDGRGCGVEFAATAPDGVREHFWLPLRDPLRVRQVDVLLGQIFQMSGAAPAGAAPAGAAPAGATPPWPTPAGPTPPWPPPAGPTPAGPPPTGAVSAPRVSAGHRPTHTLATA